MRSDIVPGACGSRTWSRAALKNGRRDPRAVSAEIRPAWDLATPGVCERWDAGDLEPFHGWGKESPGRLTSVANQAPPPARSPTPR